MKNYYQPTPVMARKIGDALLLIASTITTNAIYQNDHKMAVIALWVGIAGKVVSNLFSDKTA